jgi:hypothetical protein
MSLANTIHTDPLMLRLLPFHDYGCRNNKSLDYNVLLKEMLHSRTGCESKNLGERFYENIKEIERR